MTKTSKKRSKKQPTESDSAYVLKLLLYILLGATWIKFGSPVVFGAFQLNGVPIGMLFGFILASHDHFAIDRKIEYALLIIMMILTYFLPAGIVL
jgi:uncharacterized membrane protein